MHLRILSGTYAVCRLDASGGLPSWWSPAGPLAAAIRRGDELSLVCAADAAPAGVLAEGPWCALEVEGPLDFSLTGIMARLAGPLAAAGVSILPLATYDTDIVLVRAERLADAAAALRAAGHTVAP